MSRPRKKGLTYYQKDLDFYQDAKVVEMLIRYGPLGITTYDVLLTMIYREGYYIELLPQKAALLVVRTVGDNWYRKNGMSPIDFATEIIQYCAEIGLFDESLMRQGVITSVGIQKRYDDVTARNKADKTKYWLLEKSGGQEASESASKNRISAAKTGVSATKTPVNAAKMQQIREDKIRVNKTITEKMTAPPKRRRMQTGGLQSSRWRVVVWKKVDLIKREYGRILPGMPTAVTTPKLLRNLAKGNCGIGTYRKVFEMAAKSTFLTKPKTGWKCDLEWLCDPANMEKVLSGKYSDYEKPGQQEEAVQPASSFDTDSFFAAAMSRAYGDAEVDEDCPFL